MGVEGVVGVVRTIWCNMMEHVKDITRGMGLRQPKARVSGLL